MAAMGFIWDIVMIPAWASEGEWGAVPVQLLVIIALPTVFICFIYGLYWIVKYVTRKVF